MAERGRLIYRFGLELLPHTALHQGLGARFLDFQGRQAVETYGQPDEEYRAAREGAVLIDASFRELVEVTGEDRVRFLHGMVTQDISGLPEEGWAYAAMLAA